MKESITSLNKEKAFFLIFFLLSAFFLSLSKSFNTLILVFIFILLSFKKEGRLTIYNGIKDPLLITFFIYLLIKAIGLIYTHDLGEGLRRIKGYINLPFVYLVIISTGLYLKDKRNVGYALLAYLSGIAFLDILGLFELSFKRPFTGLGMHHIWFGNLNALAIYALVSFLILIKDRVNKINLLFIAFLFLLFLFSVVMSTSRTAWLGMVAVFSVILFKFFRNKRLFWYGATGLLILLILAYFTFPVISMRISQAVADISEFASGNPATSIGARFTMWKASLKIFLTNPLFGAGTGDYRREIERLIANGEIPEFISQYNQPHNIYMNELSTNGLIGLFALIFIFIKAFRLFPENKLNILSWFVLIHYLVAGLTESLFNIHVLIVSFAFLLGIVRVESILKEDR